MEQQRKRKHTAKPQTVSLLQFIQLIIKITPTGTLEKNTYLFPSTSNIIGDFFQATNAKHAKFNDDIDVNDDEAKFSEFTEKINNERLVSQIIHEVIHYICSEFVKQNYKIDFPFNYCIHYLASSFRFVKTPTFENISIEPSKNKTSKLNLGQILIEYAKAPLQFQQHFANCNESDLTALKLIHRLGIRNKINIYYTINQIKREWLPNYKTDEDFILREDFKYISIYNFKRAFIFLTNRLTYCINPETMNYSFLSASIEKDLPMNALLMIPPKQYIVLDVLFATRITVIDVLANNLGIDLDQPYAGRLEGLNSYFDGAFKLPTFETNFSESFSYIAKNPDKIETAQDIEQYIYMKPLPTVAIVGIHNKSALVGLLNQNGEIEVTSSIDFVGNSILPLTIFSTQASAQVENNTAKVKLYNEPITVVKIPDDSYVFMDLPTYELRENNKIGELSNAPVSNISIMSKNKNKDNKKNCSSFVDMHDSDEIAQTILKSTKSKAVFESMLQAMDPSEVLELVKSMTKPNVDLANIMNIIETKEF